jgi:hypothetical protein
MPARDGPAVDVASTTLYPMLLFNDEARILGDPDHVEQGTAFHRMKPSEGK